MGRSVWRQYTLVVIVAFAFLLGSHVYVGSRVSRARQMEYERALATVERAQERERAHERFFERAWNILSDDEAQAYRTIAAAAAAHATTLHFSHQLGMRLSELREDRQRRELLTRLSRAAALAGLRVVLWEHCMYELAYYPRRFTRLINGSRALDLDDDALWRWIEADYAAALRALERSLPPRTVVGVAVTFIETATRVHAQFSRRAQTPAARLALVLRRLYAIFVRRRALQLIVRTFGYTHAEYAAMRRALLLVADDDAGAATNVSGALDVRRVLLMIKATPHDFFLTHPPNAMVGDAALAARGFRTLVELDAAGEYAGHAAVAPAAARFIVRWWLALARRRGVVGYVARTDRYGGSGVVGQVSAFVLALIDDVTRYVEATTAADGGAAQRLRRPRFDDDDDADEGAGEAAGDDAAAAAAAAAAEAEEVDAIYSGALMSFAAARFGGAAAHGVASALALAAAAVSRALYTLGIATAAHSALSVGARTTFTRHVAARWLGGDDEPPAVVTVGAYGAHDRVAAFDVQVAGGLASLREPYAAALVSNKDDDAVVASSEDDARRAQLPSAALGVAAPLHYWRDVVEYLAPADAKEPRGRDGRNAADLARGFAGGYLTPTERMDRRHLALVLAEKDEAVVLARTALRGAVRAYRRAERRRDEEPETSNAEGESTRELAEGGVWWNRLFGALARTEVVARIHRAAAAALFGRRAGVASVCWRALADLTAFADARLLANETCAARAAWLALEATTTTANVTRRQRALLDSHLRHFVTHLFSHDAPPPATYRALLVLSAHAEPRGGQWSLDADAATVRKHFSIMHC